MNCFARHNMFIARRLFCPISSALRRPSALELPSTCLLCFDRYYRYFLLIHYYYARALTPCNSSIFDPRFATAATPSLFPRCATSRTAMLATFHACYLSRRRRVMRRCRCRRFFCALRTRAEALMILRDATTFTIDNAPMIIFFASESADDCPPNHAPYLHHTH